MIEFSQLNWIRLILCQFIEASGGILELFLLIHSIPQVKFTGIGLLLFLQGLAVEDL